MELFKLFGTIALKNEEANRGIDETSDKAKGARKDVEDFGDEGTKTESKLGSAFSKIGSAAAKVGKAIGVGMLAAGGAVVAVGKKALDSYADYEQLVGGVETLFEDLSDDVIDNSKVAYKTAGLSANEYLETVMGFSASLNQSLQKSEGNIARSAELSNQIIIDMSDNANKMGSDMESIQNAYNGFAKQNYTMLDNLKLGYGGTKEEMQRLLEDAEKLSGIKYDISSFADIAEAIHVVQTEMGITGTTAKEASTTIQGSIQSAKSAWQNLITGLADDNANLDELVNNFFNSIVTVGENIIPRIGIILDGIAKAVEKIAPKLVKAIPGIVSKLLPEIVKGAQTLLKAAVDVIPQLAKLIVQMLPDIISAFEQIFETIVDALNSVWGTLIEALPTLLPQLITALIDMVVYVLEHFGEILQPIIDNLPKIIISIVDALMDNLPSLIDGLISLTLGIVEAIPQIIMGLIQALPTIIEKIITGLLNCLPQLVEGAIQLVIGLVTHLPEIIMGLIQAIPKIVVSIAQALVEAGPKIWEAFTEIFSKAWTKIQEIFAKVGEWFTNMFSKAWEGIKGIWNNVVGFFQGIWDGICSVFSAVGDWFKGVFEGAWNGIKSIWNGVTGFFRGIWNGIVSIFQGVGNWFSNIWNSAVSGVKNAWNGIQTWFQNLWNGICTVIKTPINWIIGAINCIIDGLNCIAIDIPDWVPGIGGQHWGFDLDHIAELAEGGVVDRPTPAIFGERGAEAVVPLENNTGWINRIAKQIHQFSVEDGTDARTLASNGGFMTAIKTEIGDRIRNLETIVARILEELQNFFPEFLDAFDVQIVLDDGTLVAELTPKIDRELGAIRKRKERG
jgi:phage-related protein